MIDKRVGKRIKECRERLGLTQEQFAEKTGFTVNYISTLERGASFPRCENLITLESVIPYETQAVRWSESDRNRYFDIASRCDWETMIQRTYTSGCLRKRNQYLLEQAEFLLAVWDGKPGRIGRLVRRASRAGKTVRVIDPKQCAEV